MKTPQLALLVTLCAILTPTLGSAQSLKGSAMHGTVTQLATVGGIRDCLDVRLTASRIREGVNQRTWLSFEIYDCPLGSTNPTHLRTSISQQINDADLDIQPHNTRMHTTVTDGTRLEIEWRITDVLHLEYDATWKNTTNGTTAVARETTDTRSAAIIGTLLGIDLAPRNGQVVTTSRQESTH